MRKVAIKAIKGDEILAQDIISDYDTLLMSAGVVLKKEYEIGRASCRERV